MATRRSALHWTSVPVRLLMVMGTGGAILAGAGGAAVSAAAPVIRMVPAHALRAAVPRARSSSSAPASTSPCWASTNWSGYAVSETSPSGLSCVPASGEAYSSVTGTWTVPTVTGSRGTTAYSAAWAGIDGFTDSSLIQAGTEQDYYGNSAHYGAWWRSCPRPRR